MGAEGGLLQVYGHELMAINLVDPPPKGTPPLGIAESASLLERSFLSRHPVATDNNHKHSGRDKVRLLLNLSS